MSDQPLTVAEARRRAAAAEQAGRADIAALMYDHLLAAHGDDSAALLGRARCGARLGQIEQAITFARRAVDGSAQSAAARITLADLLVMVGRPAEAREHAERAAEITPRDPMAHHMVAVAAEGTDDLDAALLATERALAVQADHGPASIMRGALLRRTGRLEESLAQLESALGGALPDHFARRAWHELALSADAIGQYDLAFTAAVQCAMTARRDPVIRMINAHADGTRVARYRETTGPDTWSRWSADDFDDRLPRPTFLAGFPGSGVRLVQQMLAAHPQVTASREVDLLQELRRELAQRLPDEPHGPARLAAMKREDAAHLRKTYWRLASAQVGRDITKETFVDALPLNIIDAPLVNAVFPEARLIVVLRDPRDVVLNCFFQDTALNSATVNFLTLEGAAHLYATVMNGWLSVRDHLTCAWKEFRYEDAVRDETSTTAELAALMELDMPDDEAMPPTAAPGRGVDSPVGRWRNYREHVTDVDGILLPFVEAFGYDVHQP